MDKHYENIKTLIENNLIETKKNGEEVYPEPGVPTKGR